MRLHIALLIPTTFIVIPDKAGANNRHMNGTGTQLLLGNIDTTYLGVSITVFSSVMLINHAFTVFTNFFLTLVSAVVKSQTLREECIIIT